MHRREPRWSHLHTVVVLVVLSTLGTLLAFLSTDVAASRNDVPDNTLARALPAAQITIPLELTRPASGDSASTTAARFDHNPLGPDQSQAQSPVQSSKQQSGEKPAVAHPDESWLTITVRRGDSLAAIFKRHDIPARELHEIMQLGRITRNLNALHPGDTVRFKLDKQQHIQQMVFDITRLKSLQISRQADDQFAARIIEHELDRRLTQSSGVIKTSLYEAGKAAGLDDGLIMQMTAIFGWDIDFVLDIRRGDHFTLIYEEQYLNGEKVQDGPIIAAEFVSQGRQVHAIRYTDKEGRSDYYSPEGYSMRKAFLRTPVDFRRISSRFGKRHHPVLNRMRMHKGVDYAARTGTPIQAAGDGKIVYRGWKGGYGRVIILKHGGRYSTLYAHMSGFKGGLRVGSRVKQGQIIGFVGRSGRVTGAHLHYEFRVNGAHRDPLTVKLPEAEPIKPAYKIDFKQLAQRRLAQLDAARPAMLALNQ
ncbi:MAG: peptidoglycan DD-metalloendopeptidase family protein [Thiohalophilus sp.]|uniref:peptidoglycan DD-metalloendopeptidase family protein n=1 Tax=Thiohalophilus sp. TaxID=3028392 RepID=UPI002870538A|nr:peptidoglycan DD-metalloendopeptidase family protein [Thiohalophilus sp.]MDR9436009.1 peptidoglycan DD-metalloendopeptidase family protein [Thiohalophilus sp.]